MKKELFKEVIIEYQERDFPELIPRQLQLPEESSKIVTVVGPRRSGKTCLLLGFMKMLNEKGVPREELVYVNFDDPRLLPCDAMCLEELLQAYRELYPEKMEKVVYLFLDEIQNVKDWETGVRRLYDTGKFRIYLTGSSSRLFSWEIATSLRGRAVSFELLPFSFREFLKARGIEADRHIFYSPRKALLKRALEEYLRLGGFPEVVLEKDQNMKLRILREYMQTMFLRDVVERYGIRNQVLLRELVKYLASNTARRFSVNAFFRWIKGFYPVTKRTLLNYTRYLEDSGIFFFLRKFSPSLKEQTLAVKKVYIVDWGLTSAYGFKLSQDLGLSLENAVFLELQRRKAENPLLEIFYWHGEGGKEVDFVVKEGEKIQALIQVCADVEALETRKREIKSLLAASAQLRCLNLLVLTLDYEATEKVNGKIIKFFPAWKWFLLQEIF